ncbi:hypothetical protein HPB49_011830 [Dermacentor silvarum]|uniref:Uncharacterized protein n=1 Tax=Dermacentor silvarum TaxID=543639 RepID=A0ACB8CKS4_DERSI|nr:hypothetical protein HPB49_011830 [Dermacentor silvarum]
MPQLPRGDYKIIIRPRGGLRVADHGAARLATCIYHAAEIPNEKPKTRTPSAHADKYQKISRIKIGNQAFETSAYEAAPDYTSKGVIRGIPLEDTARDITANVITPRNPTAIAAKRLSNTMTVIVLFTGLRVPTYVRYGGALLPCSLYRKQIDTCYQCGRLGHHADERQQEEDYPTKPTLVNTNLEQRDPPPSQKPGGRGWSRSRTRSPSRSRTRSRTPVPAGPFKLAAGNPPHPKLAPPRALFLASGKPDALWVGRTWSSPPKRRQPSKNNNGSGPVNVRELADVILRFGKSKRKRNDNAGPMNELTSRIRSVTTTN